MRFRSKPSEIEAVQYGPEWESGLVQRVAEFIAGRSLANDAEIVDYVRPDGAWDPPDGDTSIQILAGKDGAQDWVPVPLGHWIVRSVGDLSDHWPVDPAYFANKYEALPDDHDTEPAS